MLGSVIQARKDFSGSVLRRCRGCDHQRPMREMLSMGPYSRCLVCRLGKHPPPEERMRLVRERLDPGPLYDPMMIQ